MRRVSQVDDDEHGVPDTLDRIEHDHLIGRRTGFVYYDDKDFDRRILVGVSLEQVKRNTFFDGPGDQVPFGLDLRERLARAYPNTLLGDGIDSHGVYLNRPEWMRIAISPFRRYATVQEVVDHTRECAGLDSKGKFWTKLTKEWWNTENWRKGVLEKLAAEGKLGASGDTLRDYPRSDPVVDR